MMNEKKQYCVLLGGALILRADSLLHNSKVEKLSRKYPKWEKLSWKDEELGICTRTDLEVTEEEALIVALGLGLTREQFYGQ